MSGSDSHGKVMSRPAFGLMALLVLCCLIVGSLSFGAEMIQFADIGKAMLQYDPSSFDQIIIREYRLPRTLLGLLCGAAFGTSGALIQAATRNPLADPGILGVNAGAAFFVVIAMGLLGWHSIEVYVWAAFAGAFAVTVIVYAIGAIGRDGPTPVRLVLTGVAVSAFLGGFSSSLTLFDPMTFDTMRLWALGSIAGRDLNVVAAVFPFLALGMGVALYVSRSLNAMALGDETSQALGVNLRRDRALVLLSVTLLSGAATAACGPIGFVGLMVPHVIRWFTGPDQRWIIGLSMFVAPSLLLGADIIGRIVAYPGELEAGIVTAFLGAPVLIMLVRNKTARAL